MSIFLEGAWAFTDESGSFFSVCGNVPWMHIAREKNVLGGSSLGWILSLHIYLGRIFRISFFLWFFFGRA
jgi:hypothetical protein